MRGSGDIEIFKRKTYELMDGKGRPKAPGDEGCRSGRGRDMEGVGLVMPRADRIMNISGPAFMSSFGS